LPLTELPLVKDRSFVVRMTIVASLDVPTVVGELTDSDGSLKTEPFAG
jgi:hypothetical protein